MERWVYRGDNIWAIYYSTIAWRSNGGLKTRFSNRVGTYKRKARETWIKVKIVKKQIKSFEVSRGLYESETLPTKAVFSLDSGIQEEEKKR